MNKWMNELSIEMNIFLWVLKILKMTIFTSNTNKLKLIFIY